MTRLAALTLAIVPALTLAACAGEPESAEEAPMAEEAMADEGMAEEGMGEEGIATRRVEIVSPAEGDTLDAGPVVVRLEAHGFQVVPAGDMTPNSGHHHLFLDRDVSPPGQPIPAEENFIVHMGTGVGEFTFSAVEPGEHRLIAVVGDALHVPLDPPLVDTVRFVVR